MQPRLRISIHVASLFLLSISCGAVPRASADPQESAGLRLTLEQTAGRGERVSFSGRLPSIRWAPDGVHLREGGEWIDPITLERTPAPEPEKGARTPRDPDLWKLFASDEVDEAHAKRVARARAKSGANGGELRKVGDELWYSRGGTARRLTDGTAGKVELEELSPDGEHVAFVRGNDLFVVDTETGALRALTRDGGEDVFNGKLDWVYQEEIYGRGTFKAFWWSPDSTHIAFLRLDESDVYDFTVIDHIEPGNWRVKPEVTKYPKVGDPNPTVSLGIASAVAPSEVRWLDLERFGDDEPLIVRVSWTPGGDRLVAMVQDRIQTWMEMLFFDAESFEATTVLRETSDSWVNRPDEPRWLADGTFLWMSERTGQRHVYHYRADGELIRAITSGPWTVDSIERIDEDAGRIWFTSTKDGAVNRNLYRIDIDGSGLVRLTPGDGTHRVTWNDAHTMFLDRVSSLSTPPRLLLVDAEGRLLSELARADMGDFERYATRAWEYHQIEARDGFRLDVALLKPVPFDPKKSYPVWIPTYSGPNAPTVRNAWNASPWMQFLAQNGIVVLQVNVRSASGKGQETTAAAYLQLGVQELADLEDAVAWVTENPWADASRVGITGGSYGGFISAFALTHSDRFALAIAASGVYDWRMYDTIYTERYMSTPDRNPEGYAKTSVVEAAANLHGHLLLTHGVMDDNVHVQNAMQLVYALQKANKSFELMLYPQNRHGISNRDQRWFDRELTWRTIQRELLGIQD
ncbi:MAG TPA: S9 family peptidase [Planctomycetes bacterium]|nr:S9 family peptidase [Planctomycetota bacterium]